MRPATYLLAIMMGLGMLGIAQPAAAQGLSRGDRLFLMYNQVMNQRAQQRLTQQQNKMSRELRDLTGQGNLRGPVRPPMSVDPVDEYLRQIEGGPASRREIPAIYGGGRSGQGSSFQQQYRYFNPQRSPLY